MKAFIQREWLFLSGVLLSLAAYSLFFSYGYISWDDPEMVFRNADVQHFSIKHFFTRFYVGNYIPLTMLLHSLNWQLFGEAAGFHHLISVLLHLFNAWLVLQLSRKLGFSNAVQYTTSFVFMLHPTQVESVGWISELKTVLYTFFFLLALLHFIEFQKSASKKYFAFSLLFFVCSVLSKPAAVSFPLVALALAMLTSGQKIKAVLIYLSPFIVMAAVFSYINIVAQTQAQFINQAHAFAYWQRFLFAGFALFKYAGLVIAPVHLSVVYAYPSATLPVLLVSAFTWLLLLGGTLLAVRKKEVVVLSALAFIVINLLPVLQFVPFGEALYADRYLYLPLVGFGMLLGMLFDRLKLPINYSVLPLAIVLGLISFQRSSVWKTALQLYENVLRSNPTSFVALNSAGVECMQQNDDAKAVAYFTAAIKDNARNYKGFYNRALLFLKEGKSAEAIQDFNACIALYEYPKAYAGRAAAYYQLQDLPKAKQDAEYALRLDAEQGKALFVLAECYSGMNQLDKALNYYDQAIAVNGSDADYFFKRAIAYGKLQNFRACIADLEMCLQLNQTYYEAYYWRGVAKVNLQQNACADFEIAAKHQIQPAITAFYKYCQ